jgi:hypothetical protein
LLGWAALVFVFIFFLVYMLHFVLDVMWTVALGSWLILYIFTLIFYQIAFGVSPLCGPCY